MIEFIKRIFGINSKKTTTRTEERHYKNQQDVVDYDGMGNYGRFPITKNGRYK